MFFGVILLLKVMLHEAISCNLQRNDDEWKTLQVALDMLHAASCLATLQKVEDSSTFIATCNATFCCNSVALQLAKMRCYTGNCFRNLQCTVCCVASCRKNCLMYNMDLRYFVFQSRLSVMQCSPQNKIIKFSMPLFSARRFKIAKDDNWE